MSYLTKSVCVVDNGLFSELATTLGRSFGKVFFTSPWVSDLPSSTQTEVGEGFPTFERVKDIWEIIDDVDLFVFTDLHQGPLQEYLSQSRYPYSDELGEHLEKRGKRVWGARNGDELETDRVAAKDYFKSLGIPQVSYEVVKGMPALRVYLKSRSGAKLWVKISLTRADTETFPVDNYPLVKNMLDTMEAELGPAAEHMDFIVEEHISDSLDVAIDTYSIDGKFPSIAAIGTEHKDEAYACAVNKWSEMPQQIVDIYESLSPTLKNFGYRSMLSLESRIREDQAWLCDPCCRCGSPPFELQMNMLKNLPDILWNGAEGKIVEPVYDGKYGVELITKSDWVEAHPLLVEFPEEYRDQIKFRHATRFGAETWIMPQHAEPLIAAIVSCGDDLNDCFAEALEISGQLKGFKVETPTGAITELQKNITTLAEWGVSF